MSRSYILTPLSLALLALSLTCLAGSCGGGPRSDYDEPPVLVVGMDGLEWSVIEPLLAQGRMPHFERLLENGTGGTLRTLVPTFSPVLWTTIATGVKPSDHGILHFAELDAQNRPKKDGLPYTSNARKVPAIWNIASDAGRDVLSVAWWVSWPAEPLSGDSRIVASYAAQVQASILWKPGVWEEGLPELTWPPQVAESIAPRLLEGGPQGPVRGEFENTFGKIPSKWKWPLRLDQLYRTAYHGDRTHVRIASDLMGERLADLNMVYIGLPDVAGHYWWRWREPSAYGYPIPGDQIKRLNNRLDLAYEVADQWLGELLEQVPSETIVMIVSDHGMHAANLGDPKALQSGAHEDAPDGVFLMSGPGVKQTGLVRDPDGGIQRIGGVVAIAPTVLDLLGVPKGSHMPGRSFRGMMTDAWRAGHPELPPVDWATSFRKPTPSKEPVEGASDTFIDNIREIGYAIGED